MYKDPLFRFSQWSEKGEELPYLSTGATHWLLLLTTELTASKNTSFGTGGIQNLSAQVFILLLFSSGRKTTILSLTVRNAVTTPQILLEKNNA